MKKEIILNKESEINEKLNKNNKIKDRISFARIIIFLLLVLFLVFAFNKQLFGIVLSSILVICLIISEIFYIKYNKISEDYSYKLVVIKDYLARFNDNWKKSNDSGNEFLDRTYFLHDLDIFGKNSLFSYISFAKTPFGRKILADRLKLSENTKEDIELYQEAVNEFENKFDDSLDITSKSYKYNKLNKDKRYKNMIASLDLLDKTNKFNPLLSVISVIYSLAFISCVILSIMKIIPVYTPFVAIGIGFFLALFIYPEAKEVSQDLIKINNIFYGYDELIDVLSKKEFDSKLLKENLKYVKSLESKSIKKYKLLSIFFESRNNIIFQLIFNGCFLLDGILLLLYKNWQKKYHNHFREGIMSVGYFEAVISLTTISYVKEISSKPQIKDLFEFSDINHPLINEEVSVPNSFKFEKPTIITGSNMSGKTTFMRSIGTNYVLYLAGSNVVCKSFKAPLLKIFTSMKVVDDVNNNISTFYGEILRIKEISDALKKDTHMLVLIDEIFKGTNTNDRIKGAKAVLNNLHKDNVYSIITTHDPELCEVDFVKNYHFLEHYEDDKIKFDYKINDGISNTSNAIYLLKISGIME